MRLGLLGPAEGDVLGLARAAEFLLNTAKVSRAVYLGADDALERTVEAWAESMLGDDPSEEGVWRRAAELALYGTVDAIDQFVKAERARLRLRALVSLPAGGARTVEILGDRVAVLIHDKAQLDEEDMLPASLLVYGKSDGPFVKKIGTRWFLTPGKISAKGGVGVLDDERDDIVATMFNPAGESTWRDVLALHRTTAKIRVQGGRMIVGVFGGSFNPPHVSHMLAVSYVLATSDVDQVLVVPTYQHPFAKRLAPYEDRLTMSRLAMGWMPRVEISRVEQELGGESRTLRTLEHLAAEHPDWQLRLIMGADLVAESPKWFGFDRVKALAPPIVIGRSGFDEPDVPSALLPSVSSTEVRAKIAAGAWDELASLVPRKVLEHIRAAGLYREA